MRLIWQSPGLWMTGACALLAVAHTGAADLAAYRRLWAEPAVNARIERNIETHRKGDLKLEVVHADGRPAAGVRIELEQTTQQFLFGCNLFALGQLGSAERDRLYEERFLGLFNFATLPFYWEGTEPRQGEVRFAADAAPLWRRPPPDALLNWCKAHAVVPKGHPLFWFNCNPDWLPADREALRKLFARRFEQIAARYAADIPIWDVVNEPLSQKMREFPLYDPNFRFIGWAFEQVRPIFGKPGHVLMINEGSRCYGPGEANPYYRLLQQQLGRGVPIQGIGFQFHRYRRSQMDTNVVQPQWSPAALLDLYERFGKFGLPLYITEISLPAEGADGPTVQAEVARNLYRLWFSVPRMAGITWWNLGDALALEKHLPGECGLLDKNLQPKPAYAALQDLIRREWTSRISGTTDAAGRFGLRGLGGEYEVRLFSPPDRARAQTFKVHVAAGSTKTTRLTLKHEPSGS